MKQFKIRCSQIGQIMSDPRSVAGKKAGVLSKTAQSYCDRWIMEQVYNRTKEFANKYTIKGNEVEESSIDFIATQLGYPMLFKNEQFFENEYMTGTPDVLPPNSDLVIDAKNSWDWSTFPYLEEDIPTKDYWWQGQGYMNLTGRTEYNLCYVLSNTPLDLIEREAYWRSKNAGFDEIDMDIYKEMDYQLAYDDLDDKLRFKKYEFGYESDAVELVIQRVIQCREYISNKLKSLNIEL